LQCWNCEHFRNLQCKKRFCRNFNFRCSIGSSCSWSYRIFKTNSKASELTKSVTVPNKTTKPSPSSTTQSDETANWKTYTDKNIGFEIKYSPSWFAVNYGKYAASKLGTPDPNQKLLLLFGKGPEPKDIVPLTHSWGDLQINVSKKPFSDQELNKTGIEQGDVVEGQALNKRQYKVIHFAGIKANKKIQLTADLVEGNLGIAIIFNANEYGWLIIYPATDYNGNNDSIYDQILSTFKFTN